VPRRLCEKMISVYRCLVRSVSIRSERIRTQDKKLYTYSQYFLSSLSTRNWRYWYLHYPFDTLIVLEEIGSSHSDGLGSIIQARISSDGKYFFLEALVHLQLPHDDEVHEQLRYCIDLTLVDFSFNTGDSAGSLRMAAISEMARSRNKGYLSYLIENISCLMNARSILDEFSIITDLNSSG
jgi:hypothetical protein